jgi:hypothetical protein
VQALLAHRARSGAPPRRPAPPHLPPPPSRSPQLSPSLDAAPAPRRRPPGPAAAPLHPRLDREPAAAHLRWGPRAIAVLTLAFAPVTRAMPGVRLGPAGEAACRPPALRGEGAEGTASVLCACDVVGTVWSLADSKRPAVTYHAEGARRSTKEAGGFSRVRGVRIGEL